MSVQFAYGQHCGIQSPRTPGWWREENGTACSAHAGFSYHTLGGKCLVLRQELGAVGKIKHTYSIVHRIFSRAHILYWHWGNHMIASEPVRQSLNISVKLTGPEMSQTSVNNSWGLLSWRGHESMNELLKWMIPCNKHNSLQQINKLYSRGGGG